MTDRLDLPPRYRRIVQALLREHVPDAEAWAYGSRVNGSSHEGSDLDLVLRSPTLELIPSGRLADLAEAFEQSNIPILVQAHDWARLPESFHQEIERDYVVVQERVEEKSTVESDWETTTWGELATLEYGKSLRGYESSEGPYRVFGTNGPIGWHDEMLCAHPSVIIGRKGAYRGVHYSATPFFVIDTAFYLKPKVEMDTRWAYYELLTQDINGLDSGSAIPSTSRKDFYGLPVQVPPLPKQRAIAHIPQHPGRQDRAEPAHERDSGGDGTCAVQVLVRGLPACACETNVHARLPASAGQAGRRSRPRQSSPHYSPP